VCVTGQLDPHALLLVLIIYVWTPPHFWALAIHRHDDYQKAKIPMLTNTHGAPYTKLQIVLYTWLLVGVTILPFATGMSGTLYLLGVMLLNLRFLYWAYRLKSASGTMHAMSTFKFSIYYLMWLFVVLLADHYCTMF
jgi:protoheme IX farnesyltransferase